MWSNIISFNCYIRPTIKAERETYYRKWTGAKEQLFCLGCFLESTYHFSEHRSKTHRNLDCFYIRFAYYIQIWFVANQSIVYTYRYKIFFSPFQSQTILLFAPCFLFASSYRGNLYVYGIVPSLLSSARSLFLVTF